MKEQSPEPNPNTIPPLEGPPMVSGHAMRVESAENEARPIGVQRIKIGLRVPKGIQLQRNEENRFFNKRFVTAL